MDYLKLFEILYKKQVRYLLCGGLAVNIYGIPRMTADIDLIVEFEKENIEKFEIALKLIAYSSTLPISILQLIDADVRRKFIREKNLIAFSYFSSLKNMMSMDVLVDVPLAFNEMWGRKEVREISDFKINIVSVDDLIALKKYANREQDKSDIILLSKIKNGRQ
jgi:hypothetical protein